MYAVIMYLSYFLSDDLSHQPFHYYLLSKVIYLVVLLLLYELITSQKE